MSDTKFPLDESKLDFPLPKSDAPGKRSSPWAKKSLTGFLPRSKASPVTIRSTGAWQVL